MTCYSKRYICGSAVCDTERGSVQHHAPSRQETNGWSDRPVALGRLWLVDAERGLKLEDNAVAVSSWVAGGVSGVEASALATTAGGRDDGFFSSLASNRRPSPATSLFGYFWARSASFSVAQSLAPSSW